jgi:hypothetical protein
LATARKAGRVSNVSISGYFWLEVGIDIDAHLDCWLNKTAFYNVQGGKMTAKMECMIKVFMYTKKLKVLLGKPFYKLLGFINIAIV